MDNKKNENLKKELYDYLSNHTDTGFKLNDLEKQAIINETIIRLKNNNKDLFISDEYAKTEIYILLNKQLQFFLKSKSKNFIIEKEKAKIRTKLLKKFNLPVKSMVKNEDKTFEYKIYEKIINPLAEKHNIEISERVVFQKIKNLINERFECRSDYNLKEILIFVLSDVFNISHKDIQSRLHEWNFEVSSIKSLKSQLFRIWAKISNRIIDDIIKEKSEKENDE